MKIIQIVSGIGAESSGPSYSVPGLCRGLQVNGETIELHTLEPDPHRDFPFKLVCYPRDGGLFSRICPSNAMKRGLLQATGDVDIIHNNGFWEMPNVYCANVVKALRQTRGQSGGRVPKLVMAPRGCLSHWALQLGKWKKRFLGALFQYPACRVADMWHATSEKEYEEIRSQGYKQPIAIVPIGMDVPMVPSSDTKKTTTRTLAFFGRIHKVKAIDSMLLAWGKIAQQFPDWRVVIAGPDCGDKGRLEKIIMDKEIPRVEFIGELNGQAKYDFLAAVDLYCLPSQTENFGVTLAEALACGVPSVASKGTPWAGLEKEKCGRWVDNDPDSLADAFKELMSLSDEERRRMGERGREWIKRDFSWEGIGAKMKAAYEWLLNPDGVERPEWVRVG